MGEAFNNVGEYTDPVTGKPAYYSKSKMYWDPSRQIDYKKKTTTPGTESIKLKPLSYLTAPVDGKQRLAVVGQDDDLIAEDKARLAAEKDLISGKKAEMEEKKYAQLDAKGASASLAQVNRAGKKKKTQGTLLTGNNSVPDLLGGGLNEKTLLGS